MKKALFLTVLIAIVHLAMAPFGPSVVSADVAFRIGLNFIGTTEFDLFPTSSIPDTMGSVGPHHIVELLNNAYAVYDKSNGLLIARITQDDFWNNALANAGGGTTAHAADARVVYDHASTRWFASALDRLAVPGYRILVGVSNSSDPHLGGGLLQSTRIRPICIVRISRHWV